MPFTVDKISGVGGLSTFVLTDGATRAEIVPERGALVARLRLRGEEVLYLDESTLADRTKNVRGGIPLLFPIAGKVPNDQIEIDRVVYPMKQHGFARNAPWEVISADAGPDLARLVCRLIWSEDTRRRFPWEFECTIAFGLERGSLAIEWQIHDASLRPMPVHAGLHPYFRVPDAAKRGTTIETDATRAFDNKRGIAGPFEGFDLTADELDLHLLDHGTPGTVLRRPGLPSIRLRWAGFRTMVVWTLAGKDFVCVEPWTAPAGALADGSAPVIEPSFTTKLRFEISI